MLREAWVLLAAAVVVAGLVASNGAIVAIGAGIGAACYAAQLWARFSLSRVRYERILPEDRAFAGERLPLTLRITNDKPLPLPWIDARERFPAAMVDDTAAAEGFVIAGQVGIMQGDWRTSIGGHQRVSRSHSLHCPHRGVFEIGPSRLRAGDMFGLFKQERLEESRTRVVVYPRTVELGDLVLPSRRPHGELRHGLPVFEDPSRVAGLRDYRPGDALRRIDWNATARRGQLQSRVYDPSSARHLLICLNTQTIVPAWAGTIPPVLERSITIAASIARDAYDRRYSVGLLANGSFPDADRSIRIPPGRRPEQFIHILEALAVVTPFVLEPIAAMLDREEHRLTLGTTICVITGIMTPELAATLLRLRRRGNVLTVLSTSGDLWHDQLGDLDVRDFSHVDAPATWAEAPL